MKTGRRFKRDMFKPSVLGRMLGDLLHRGRREASRQAKALQAPAAPRRRDFALEMMEPRVLMSADIAYTPNLGASTVTVSASGSGGSVFIDVAQGATTLAHRQLSVAGDVTVNIASLGQATAETVRFKLDTFSVLNSFVNANGGVLTLDLASGSEVLFDDHVFLDGTAATLDYGLKLHTSADLTIGAKAGFKGDLTLASDDSITGTAATDLSAKNLTLQSTATRSGGAIQGTGILANADSAITLTSARLTATEALVLDAKSVVTVNETGIPIAGVSGAVVTSFSSAKIAIGGTSVLQGKSVDITALVQAKLSASATANTVKLVVLAGGAAPDVTISGTSRITATNALNVSAKSDTLIEASAKPGSSATTPFADAAVATTTFASGATLSIGGAASLTATAGAATLIASSKLVSATMADAAVPLAAGAAVAVSAISGDTNATVAGATVTGATVRGTSVTVSALSDRTITTTAKSAPGGAVANAGQTQGEKTLAKQDTATSQGKITVGGAVAVGTNIGATTAVFRDAVIDAKDGAARLTASSVDISVVTADGSFTQKGSTGVGVGIAIGVVNRPDRATIAGITNVTAASLVVEVLAPKQSSFKVDATSGVGDSTKVGFAGSLAINIVTLEHLATLERNTSLTLFRGPTSLAPPDVTFKAVANVAHIAKALPTDGGSADKVGIGASVAIHYAEDRTDATIGDNTILSGAGDLTLIADASHTMDTEAKGGGKGGVALTPIVAIAIAANDVKAALGSGFALEIGGDFKASASLSNSVTTTAAGDTKSGKTGVGLSLALNVVNDNAIATTGRDLLAASGAAAFMSSAISASKATSKASVVGGNPDDGSDAHDGPAAQSMDNDVTKETSFASKLAATQIKTATNNPSATTKGTQGKGAPSVETSSGRVSVAGAIAINLEDASSTAFIDGGRTITTAGLLSVTSQANVDGSAIADGSAVVGSTEFDPTTAVDTTANTIDLGAEVVAIRFNPADTINTVSDTIDLGAGSGIDNGEKIVYVRGKGNTDIGGLKDGTAYYAFQVSAGKFQLYDTAANATTHGTVGRINLTTTGDGTQHALKQSGAGASVKTGDAITYFHGTGGTDIGGLSDGNEYYVNVGESGKVKLYDTEANAKAGGATGLVDLTAKGSGTSHAARGAGGTAVGAAVAVNYASDSNLAYIGNSTFKVGGLKIEATTADHAYTFDAKSAVNIAQDTVTLEGAGPGTGDAYVYEAKGGTAIGGLKDGTEYYVHVADDGTIRLYDTADAAIAGGKDGLRDLTSVGSGSASLTESADTFSAAATSGAGGGKTSVAGSLAINIALIEAQATMGYTPPGALAGTTQVTITGGGDVALTASTASSSTASAQPTDGGGVGTNVGVGISVAVNYAETATLARVADGVILIGASDLTLAATSDQTMTTDAKSGAKGSKAFTPVVAVAIANNATEAKLGSGAAIVLTGGFSATATLKDTVISAAEGDTESNATGIGLSIVVTVVNDTAVATTGRDLDAQGGAVTFDASTVSISDSNAMAGAKGGQEEDSSGSHSDSNPTDQTVNNATKTEIQSAENLVKKTDPKSKGTDGKAVTDKATTSDGTVSVAGAVAVNVGNASAMAFIPDGRRVTSSGLLTVRSATQVDGHAIATGTAASAKSGTGVGVAVAVNVVTNTNLASIGTNTTTRSAGLVVDAGMAARAIDIDSSTRQVVDIARDTIFIGADTGLISGDDVTYSRNGGTAIGGLTDGRKYYAHVLDDGTVKLYDTEQRAKDGEAAGLVDLTGAGTAGQQHRLLHGILAFLGEGSVTFTAGPIRLLDLGTDNGLHTGDAITYSAGGGAVMGGLTDNRGYYLIELTDGQYQVAATLDDARNGKAIVLTSAGNAAQTFIDATSASRAEAISGGSGGKIGFAGAVAVNVAINNSQAVVNGISVGQPVGNMSMAMTGGGNLSITAVNNADSVSHALPSSGGGQGKSVGVGASVAVNVVNNTTIAKIADNTTWSGVAGTVRLGATSATTALTHAENGATSAKTAIGIGAAVAVIHDTTNAWLGTGTTIAATGDVTIVASHTGDFETSADARAAGKGVAVGASVAVAVISEGTEARLARGITTSGGAFTLTSESTVASRTIAVATAKGASATDPLASSKNNKALTGADAQADRQLNDNANTKGADTKLPSADSLKSGPDGKAGGQGGGKSGGIGVAASVAVNVLSAHNVASITNGADVSAKNAVTIQSQAEVDMTAKAVGTSLGMESDGTRVGVGVALNVATGSNRAVVNAGSEIAGAGITIAARPPADKTNEFTAWAAAAAGGKGSASVAGSVAINVVTDFTTEAATRAGSSLTSTGLLTVQAIAAFNPQTVAAGAALSKDISVGVAVAVAVLDVTTDASIGGSATASGQITVDAQLRLAPTQIDLPILPDALKPVATSIAVAGAVGTGSVAGAGSFIVNDFTLRGRAYAGDGATITAGQGIAITALNSTTITSIAGALGATSGAVGFGASLDLEILNKETKAAIGNNARATAGGGIDLIARADDTMLSVAGTFGGGKTAGIALTASIALVTTRAEAFVGTASTVTAGGTLSVHADNYFKTTMIAGSVGLGGTAGVGAANATLDHVGITRAFIGNGADISVGGGLQVRAGAQENILSIVAGIAVGGTAGVAGSAAINILNETTTAFVGRSAKVTTGFAGVLVTARDDTTVIGVAGSLAAGGTGAAGVGVDVGTYIKRTDAYIDSGAVVTVARGNITVAANAYEDLISVAAGAAFGGSIAVGVNAGVHVFDLRTRAFIGDDPTDAIASAGAGDVHAGGNIVVSADGYSKINEVVGVLAAGTVGVAAGAGVTVSTKQTKAFIGNGAKVRADGLDGGSAVNTGLIDVSINKNAPKVLPKSLQFAASAVNTTTDAIQLGTASDLRTGDRVGYAMGESGTVIGGLTDGATYFVRDVGNGDFKLYRTAADAQANTNAIDLTSQGAGANQTFHGGLGIETSSSATLSNAASGDRSSFAEQGSIGTPKLTDMDLKGDKNAAPVDDESLTGARVTANGLDHGFKGLAVTATSRDEIKTFTITFGAGTVGVAVSAGIADISATTEATIGDNAQINTVLENDFGAQSVLVGAGSDFYHLSLGVGVAVGSVGIAPTVGVNLIRNNTIASIGTGATVRARDDITVQASAKENVVMIGMGVAGGGIGVGAVVNVLSIDNTTSASINAAATVRANGDVFVFAADDTHVLELSGALAGGAIGVGGAVGVMLLEKDTTASIGAGAQVRGLGYDAGVSGVLTGATVGNGSATENGRTDFETTTGHGVIVLAASREDILHITAAGGGGLTAGVAGAVSVTLIRSATAAIIDTGADINQGLSGADPNQSVLVHATNNVKIRTFVVGVGVGGVAGVAGSFDVGTLNNNVTAEIRADANVSAWKGIEVYALGMKKLTGYTISGAGGGIAGIGASVSVWSIGTKLEKNYAGDDGKSESSVKNEEGTPDADAASQAGQGTALITGGKGIGSLVGDGQNTKTSANRIGSVVTAVGTGIAGRAPTAASIGAEQARTGVPSGTAALVQAGADLVTLGDIRVTAHDIVTVKEVLGQIAAGGVAGIGASIGIFSMAANVTAANNGNNSAVGDVQVNALLNTDMDVTSVGMAAGFVGLGAGVVIIDDNSLAQATLGNVSQARDVAVTSSAIRTFSELTGQAAVGAIGAGVTFTRLNIHGGSTARVNDGAVIGNVTAVRSLSVQASSNIKATVSTVAVSAGIGAVNVNFAELNADPTISATIGARAQIKVTGKVEILAETFFDNRATTFGVSAGGLAVGVSKTQVSVAPTQTASIGAQANIAASELTMRAGNVVGDGAYNAQVKATGSAGALVGITSTSSKVTNNSKAKTFIGDAAVVAVTGAVTIGAINNTRQKAEANSNSGGLVAAGIATASTNSDTRSEAYLGQNVTLTASTMTLSAIGVDDNLTLTNAGSGGAIAGSAAIARTSNTSVTLASIGAGARVTLLAGTGALSVGAEHTARFNSQVTSIAGGLLAGAGGDITNNVDANVTALIGNGAVVQARSIEVNAVNHFDKPLLTGSVTENMKGTTGGLASAAGANAETTIFATTKVRIGDGAQITVVGIATNAHTMTLAARNDFNVIDKIAFKTAGAVSGAKAFAAISVPTAIAAVEIGRNAVLTTANAVDISARGAGELREAVFVETYGVATAAAGATVVDIRPVNQVLVGSGTTISALGDMNLSAGSDTKFNEDVYKIGSRFDGFAGSLIPLSSVSTTAFLIQNNIIEIDSGANLRTARTANLFTGRNSFNDIDAKAKITNWASDDGPSDDYANATIKSLAVGVIQMDGKVETGIARNQHLTLSEWDGLSGKITKFDKSEAISFTEAIRTVSSPLVEDLKSFRQRLAEATNLTERAFLQDQITTITAQLDAAGLISHDRDSSGNPVNVARDIQVMSVTVNPIYADSGAITTRGDIMQGSGTWIAPNDVSVTILNDTPAYLTILGIQIPDRLGGLYFDGVQINTTADIADLNAKNMAEDKLPSTVPPQVGFDLNGVKYGVTEPTVVVSNRIDVAFVNSQAQYFVNDRSPNYGPPALTVAAGIGVSNLLGSATFTAKGTISFDGSVKSKTLTVVADDRINIADAVKVTGGEPIAQWAAATTGTYNPDTPFQTAPGVKRADIPAIVALIAAQPTGDVIVADRIFITSNILNLNGRLQSGKSDYVIRLEEDAARNIAELLASGRVGQIRLDNFSTVDYTVMFDTFTRRIEVLPLTVNGGYIDIKSNIVNTGNGSISVFGGYGKVEIVNRTGFDLGIQKLDVSQRGAGLLIIRDESKGTPGHALVTTYRRDQNGLTVTTDNEITTTTATNQPNDLVYKPASDWRYGWTVAMTQQVTKTATVVRDSWLSIPTGGTFSGPWDKTETEQQPTVKEGSPHYFRSFDPREYRFQSVVQADVNAKQYVKDRSESTTWYGEKSVTQVMVEVSGKRTEFIHDISASRDIGIHFFGHDSAVVLIQSVSGDVYIDGPILNPTGTTAIASTRRILSGSPDGSVGGHSVILQAQEGIGDKTAALQVNVSQTPASRLFATSAAGGIVIAQKSGDLAIDYVSAAGLGSVILTAPGSIKVSTTNGPEGDGIVGGSISLTSTKGGIGNSTETPLLIATPSSIGGSPHAGNGLDIHAQTDVFLQLTSGDMRVRVIETKGDVWIDVPYGAVVDANTSQIRDERTREELKASVWSSLQLTADTGYELKVQETIAGYQSAKTQDYFTYWQIRKTQPNGGAVFDGAFQVSLSVEEVKYYTTELGYDNATIQALAVTRTAIYRALNGTFGVGGSYALNNNDAGFVANSFNRTFAYKVTDAEKTALRATIKLWTEEELLSQIGSGLMKDVTSTEVNIEDPNIVGANVTIRTRDSIGANGGETVIDRTIPNVLFTEDQQIALAAAERLDVQFLGGAALLATVNFDASSRTITRTDGGNWLAGGLQAGMFITIDGADGKQIQNDTIGSAAFPRIVSVTADVITIDDSFPLVRESSRYVRLAPVVLDPRFRATAAPSSAVVRFLENTLLDSGRIVRADGGSWLTEGFAAGQLLRISGASVNATTGVLAYTIASVTDTIITLKSSARITTETKPVSISLTRGVLPVVTAIRVSHLDDIDVNATGRIKLSADGPILLGSTTDIRLGYVVNASSDDGNDIRIKTTMSILNASGTVDDPAHQVDLADDTVRIDGADFWGTGDRVTYHRPEGGTAIGGLIDGFDYFLYALNDGRFQLYQTRDEALVHGSAGRVDLVGTGSGAWHIFRQAGDGDPTIGGKNLILEAAQGGIGQANAPLVVRLVDGGSLTARARDDVHVSAAGFGAAQDLRVESVFSAQGDVVLTAAGSILEAFNNDLTKIKARHILLTAAAGGIGGPGTGSSGYLDLDAQVSVTADAFGDIRIAQGRGDLNVDHIMSANANVFLRAAGSILDAASDAGLPGADVIGRSISLDAVAGGVGRADNALDIKGQYSGFGALSASSGLLNIYINETTSNLQLGSVRPGAKATAFITNLRGDIRNGAKAGDINIQGVGAVLVAARNIGATDNRVTTQVEQLEAQSITGSVWIDNIGALAIGGTVSDRPNGIVARGGIAVSSSGPITVAKSILAGASISIVAIDDRLSPGSAIGGVLDRIVVNGLDAAGQQVSIKSGLTIRLLAGDDLVVRAGALVQAGTLADLQVDYQGDRAGNAPPPDQANADPLGGGSAAIAGTVKAPKIRIQGQGDQDQITVSATGVLVAAYPWTPASWNAEQFGTLRIPFKRPVSAGASSIIIDGKDSGDRITLSGTIKARQTDIFGGLGDDNISLNPGSAGMSILGQVNIWGGNGRDNVTIVALNSRDLSDKYSDETGAPGSLVTGLEAAHLRDTVFVDGQAGADQVTINATGATDSIVTVHDSGPRGDSGAPGGGSDELILNGTGLADTVLLRSRFIAMLQASGGGFAETYERINYDTSIELLRVNTAGGDDRVYVDDNSALTVLDGGTGADLFQVGQVFGAPRTAVDRVQTGDEIATTPTTAGALSRGISFATTVLGGEGDDVFLANANNAPLFLAGGGGDDRFTVSAFLGAGATGQVTVNAPVRIDGGKGINSATILATDGDDALAVTQTAVFGAGLAVDYTDIQRLEVDGLAGDDRFHVLGTAQGVVTTLIGGQGNDRFDTAGDVSGPIIAQSVDGQPSAISHAVSSADPAFNGIAAPGLTATVSNRQGGVIAITESGGTTRVIESGSGASTIDTYTLKFATVAPTTPTLVYLTVSAALAPSEDLYLGARSVEISTDGINFSQSLTLVFDSTATTGARAWFRVPTITVRAPYETVAEARQTVVISHAMQSDNPAFDRLPVGNVEVEVIDAAIPAVIVTQVQGATGLIGGGVPGTYSLALTQAPAAGETVSVRLSPDVSRLLLSANSAAQAGQFDAATNTVRFTAANWTTPFVVKVLPLDGATMRNVADLAIPHTVSSSLANGVYAGVVEIPAARFTVNDSRVAGLIVTQSNGTTAVASGTTDSYTLRLSKAPTSDVVVGIASDGKTLISSPVATDTRFSVVDGKARVTFNATNWATPFSVRVSNNPNAPVVDGPPVQSFPAQPHLASLLQGPLVIEGDAIAGRDRGRTNGVILPTETDTPISTLTVGSNVKHQTDTINLFNDGSQVSDLGGLTNPTNGTGLAAVYGVPTAALPLAEFGAIAGLGMGGTTTMKAASQFGAADLGFEGGITYRNVEVVDVLLGTGADEFTVKGTTPGSITVVQGGGGADRLTSLGHASGSALVLFGDTGQDGSFYDSTTGTPTFRARQFRNPGDDTLDASKDANPVVLYGGAGADILIGGSAGDWIAGGSGADVLSGGLGANVILGDDGFNLDLSTRLSLAPQVLRIVSQGDAKDTAFTADALTAGADSITAGTGNEIVIGDHGLITRTAGSASILTTTAIIGAATARPEDGGNDTITLTGGRTIVLGGTGADKVTGTGANPIVLGDNGAIIFDASARLVSVQTTDPLAGGIDTITLGANATVMGGTGADVIGLGNGASIVFGDFGKLSFTNGALSSIMSADVALGGGDTITVGLGHNVILGGTGNDKITAGNGGNIVLGGNGLLTYDAAGKVVYVQSNDSSKAGTDTIAAGTGVNLVLQGPVDAVVPIGQIPVWQMAARSAVTATLDAPLLDARDLVSIVDRAEALWVQALGPDDTRLQALSRITVEVADLPNDAIGVTIGAMIFIDRDAAGWGWFVDPTPGDNLEFSRSLAPGLFSARMADAAFGRMDLLSTVLHELGNAMGFPEDTGSGVASMTLDTGIRRLPAPAAGGIVPHIAWGQQQRPAPDRGTLPPDGILSPAWLDGFVNNLGQGENWNNPNARIRLLMPTRVW